MTPKGLFINDAIAGWGVGGVGYLFQTKCVFCMNIS